MFFFFVAWPFEVSSKDLCGGQRIEIEMSPYWEPFFYVNSPDIPDGRVRFLFDSAANYNAIDITSIPTQKTKLAGSISIESNPMLFGEKPSFSISKIYSKEGSKAVNGVLGMSNFIDKSVEMDFYSGEESLYISASSCSEKITQDSKMMPISQKSFYGRSEATPSSKAYSDLNLPVAFIMAGGVFAPALIDTGYRNDPGGSMYIKVNKKLYDLMKQSGISVIDEEKLPNYDCKGNLYYLSTFHLSVDELEIVDEKKRVIRSYPSSKIKFVAAEENTCSKFGELSKPMALLDSSFVGSWGRVVVDGLAQTVWIKSDR